MSFDYSHSFHFLAVVKSKTKKSCIRDSMKTECCNFLQKTELDFYEETSHSVTLMLELKKKEVSGVTKCSLHQQLCDNCESQLSDFVKVFQRESLKFKCDHKPLRCVSSWMLEEDSDVLNLASGQSIPQSTCNVYIQGHVSSLKACKLYFCPETLKLP